jgi:DNA repair protein RadC
MPELNEGHRERLRRRFEREGLDSFEPHEVLELLLFYVIPRGNVNHIGHRLINRFGSLAGVFNATAAELQTVDGVGESSALYLSLLPAVCRRYLMSSVQDKGVMPLSNSAYAHEYAAPYFVGRTVETLYLICLNNAGIPVECSYISEGTINATQIDMRRIVEAVVRNNAVAAILCHNHPDGIAKPSPEDIAVTRKAAAILDSIGVVLLDHLILVDGDFVSFHDSEETDKIVAR